MSDLPLDDIQGFVLRTYAMPALRIFALKVERPLAAGRVLAALTADPSAAAPVTTVLPRITSAVTWTT